MREGPGNPIPTYLELLRRDFDRLRRADRALSIRAYAIRLGISHTEAAAVLGGKKRLSSRLAARIVERLELAPAERELFLLSVEFDNASSEEMRILIAQKIRAVAGAAEKPTESRELYVVDETLRLSEESYRRVRDAIADARDLAHRESRDAAETERLYRLTLRLHRQGTDG